MAEAVRTDNRPDTREETEILHVWVIMITLSGDNRYANIPPLPKFRLVT